MRLHVIWIAVLVVACGAPKGTKPHPPDKMGKMDSMIMEGMDMPADDGSTFGPLEVGADWGSYTKLNKAAFPSETHGGRDVDVYVNPAGLDAYKAGGKMPEGSIVVKTSHQADGTEGPVFVMEKRAAGFNPEHGDWYFAIHWADPRGKWLESLKGPIYWRTPSAKASYCADCHDGYDDHDGMGGIPEDQRAW